MYHAVPDISSEAWFNLNVHIIYVLIVLGRQVGQLDNQLYHRFQRRFMKLVAISFHKSISVAMKIQCSPNVSGEIEGCTAPVMLHIVYFSAN